jgi:CheY-like chemotaxis protein/Tfp pilus assembly protein PilZ
MGDSKLLLFSDKDRFRQLAARVSETAPRIFYADNLESALENARRERPELVLIAADLQGFDAIGGCGAFKQDDGLRSITVIVLASDNEADAEPYWKAGCDDYLVMPVDRTKLFSYLQRYIPSLELQEERAPFYSQVTIRDDDDLFYGMTGDISGGGLFVATFDGLPAAGEISLSFKLADDKATLVETRGRVVWLNSKKHPVSSLPEGFGVEFTSISREEYLAIKKFVATARKKSQPIFSPA